MKAFWATLRFSLVPLVLTVLGALLFSQLGWEVFWACLANALVNLIYPMYDKYYTLRRQEGPHIDSARDWGVSPGRRAVGGGQAISSPQPRSDSGRVPSGDDASFTIPWKGILIAVVVIVVLIVGYLRWISR